MFDSLLRIREPRARIQGTENLNLTGQPSAVRTPRVATKAGSTATHRGERLRLELNDGVADADDAAHEDVGVDSGPVGELFDDPRSCHRLEMATRLAELHAEALDFANAKAFPYEAVDIHVAHGHLASSLAWPQVDVLDNLGGDERQRLAWRSSVSVEMTVTFEPLPGDSLHRLDRPKFWLAWSPEMDRLHRHCSIMHQSPADDWTSVCGAA